MPFNKTHCLSTLLEPWLTLPESLSKEISGMTLDSRQIKNNDLFVALQGALLDGRKFINNALQSGASVVLSETKVAAEHGIITEQNDAVIIQFYQLPQILSELAYRFYFPASDCHRVIGITGTNGKTTIATLLANSLTLLKQKSAQMGTIGNGIFGALTTSLNTTLDPLSVFANLNEYQLQGAKYTLMEVSSHGLVQGRVKALPFHSAIFTNLTRDHLDYHGCMQEYEKAKQILFNEFPVEHRIINLDDDVGKKWLNEYNEAISFSAMGKRTLSHRYLSVKNIQYLAKGLTFNVESSWGNATISAPFYGDFNVSNLAAVITQLVADEFALADIEKITPLLDTVAGRMEQYHFPLQQSTFVVDYAHTPDALEKALIALKKHTKKGRLICVFGCGGDRDKGKRAEMAKVSENFADKVVLVDDNPRTEPAEQIMQDILAGFDEPQRVDCIHDRKQAITELLAQSRENDLILVAGKGHEDYQIIGDKRIDYSDRVLLASLQLLENKKQDL